MNGNTFHRVLHMRWVNEDTFVLRFERCGLSFVPGQHLSIAAAPFVEYREYSVYSAVQDKDLEVLVKQIPGGTVSLALSSLKRGDQVSVWGPLGEFTLPKNAADHPLLFVATGTGISPFHSFVLSNELGDYRIIHGVRDLTQVCEPDWIAPGKYLTCTSRSSEGDFHGRVTAWLAAQPLLENVLIFLCGNATMISEAFALLVARNIPSRRIFSEIYF